MNKTIEIIVTPTGETTVQTKGFAGASCQAASKLIERALGKRRSEALTGEFYQATAQRISNQQRS